jgi:hypothetical protein
MDEKTEQLRDIFMDVAGEGSVTESQAAGRGSLTDADEATVEERLGETVARMRERYEFRTGLEDDALVTVVRGFYAGRDDGELAEDLGVDASAVREARLDLHLLRESDDDADFDVAAFRKHVVDDATDAELAGAFDIDTETAARHRRVVESQTAARGVSHRFTSEFEDALADAGLAVQHTAAVRETGLDEATEDIDSLDSDADVSM